MDYQKVFEDTADQAGFIKTTVRPPIDGAQKAALNRKGNILLNSGDVEGARRVFLTTGYSDGLARVGDCYRDQGRPLDALRMYWMAPDRTKAEPIMMRLTQVLRDIIQEEGDIPNVQQRDE